MNELKVYVIMLLFIVYTIANATKYPTEHQAKEDRITEVEIILRQQSKLLEKQGQQIEGLHKTVRIQKDEIEYLKTTLSMVQRKQTSNMKKFSVLRELIVESKREMKAYLFENIINSRDSSEVEVSNEAIPKPKRTTLSLDRETQQNDDADYSRKEVPRIQEKLVPFDREIRLLNAGAQLQPSTPTAAFYAYISHTESKPGAHHTLIFDTAKSNTNNCYNPFSGVFTAPADGMYIFIYSIRMVNGAYGSFEIVKNGDAQGVIYINSIHSREQTSTGTIVTTAKTGDIVYVRTHTTYPITGDVYSDQYGRPHFAGWQILP